MKVLVVNTMVPFVWGGAEELAVHLVRRLVDHGHEAELLRVPFQWEPAARIPSQMLMMRGLEIENVDHVIALKFPAYLIRHPRKTLWVLHQYRQAYELFGTEHSNLPNNSEGESLRQIIKGADGEAFAESRAIYVNSPVTRDRMSEHNGVVPIVLPPPLNDPEMFGHGSIGDYVFLGGRINGIKRQHLVLEAMAHADPSVKLVVAGPPDSPSDERRVREVVERLGIADRVLLDIRMLPRSVYAGYVNGAAAVAYIPFDEDSLGYVSMEAAIAGRPIITTTDSGGVLGLVRDDVTGWVAEPNPMSLGRALSAACANVRRSEDYGAAARELWMSLGINWSATLEALLA